MKVKIFVGSDANGERKQCAVFEENISLQPGENMDDVIEKIVSQNTGSNKFTYSFEVYENISGVA